LKALLAASFLYAAASITTAQPIVLVTEEEARASRAAPPMLAPRTATAKDAPAIEVLKPTLQGAIPSPTPVEVRFKAKHPATVRPETFKVYYGAFQIDITKRLTAAAQVTAQGISVKAATLPSGKHRLNLSIEDSADRVGRQQIEFEIL
jgi:hypothetical protein